MDLILEPKHSPRRFPRAGLSRSIGAGIWELGSGIWGSGDGDLGMGVCDLGIWDLGIWDLGAGEVGFERCSGRGFRERRRRGGGGDKVPQFYIYKLPIVRFSGCYWYQY